MIFQNLARKSKSDEPFLRYYQKQKNKSFINFVDSNFKFYFMKYLLAKVNKNTYSYRKIDTLFESVEKIKVTQTVFEIFKKKTSGFVPVEKKNR